MKENRIKLIAVIVLAFLFMLAFTCCVNKDIVISDNGEKGQITLFTPPDTTVGTSTDTSDPYVTTEPIITMPPPPSSDTTTTRGDDVTTSVPIDTTDSEDTVYNDFSGLY